MKKLALATMTTLALAGTASATTVTVLTADPSIGFYDTQTTYHEAGCEFDPNKISEYEKELNDLLLFLSGENVGVYIVDYKYDNESFTIKTKSSIHPTLKQVIACNP